MQQNTQHKRVNAQHNQGREGVFTQKLPRKSLVSRFRTNKKGAVAIEGAFLFPIMIALVLGIMEIGVLAYTSVALESLTTQAGREASIGVPATAGSNRAEFASALIRDKAANLIGGDGVRIDSKVISVTENNPDSPPEENLDICLDPYGVGIPDCLGAFEDVNGNGVYDGEEEDDDFGTATEVVEIKVTLPWRGNLGFVKALFGSDGVALLTASTIVKNEPF